MFNRLKILFIFIVTIFMLVACGTANKNPSNNADGNQGNENPVEDIENDDEKKEEPPVENEEKEDEEKNEENEEASDKIRIFETSLIYHVDGKEKEETAFLTNSDNQNYSIYLLPEYELTGEEPNKDVLFVKENDSLFMRIEILPLDIDMDNAVETIKAQLSAVNSKVDRVAAVDDHKWLKDAEIYTAKNDDGAKVIGVLKKKDDFTLKLTIFSNEEAKHEDAFLKMAETIDSK